MNKKHLIYVCDGQATWGDWESSKKFYENMPIKVKLFHKVHTMYDHNGSNAPHWKRAATRSRQHEAWFKFQTEWV